MMMNENKPIDKVTLAEKRLSGTCLVCDLPIMRLLRPSDFAMKHYQQDAELLCKWHYRCGAVTITPKGPSYLRYAEDEG